MPPKQIGRYAIKKLLGRGGMASVYLGYDPTFEREVAVKVLPRAFLNNPKFIQRFEREAKTIASLEHPAIVPVYDFGEDEDQPFLTMRYMHGGSLADRLESGKIALEDTALIFERLAPALDYAHKRNVIHRDLKPGNILFDTSRTPYLTDFGIAKLTEGTSADLTGTGVVGTPAYMSPEQARGHAIDSRTDIYALGVILYEMLTGEQPYFADTPLGLAMQHIQQPIPDIRKVAPDLPRGLKLIISLSMAKEAEGRYASASAMAQAVREIVEEEEEEIEKKVEPAPPTRVHKRPLSATIVEEPLDLGPMSAPTRKATPEEDAALDALAQAPPRFAQPDPYDELYPTAEDARSGIWGWILGLGSAGVIGLLSLIVIIAGIAYAFGPNQTQANPTVRSIVETQSVTTSVPTSVPSPTVAPSIGSSMTSPLDGMTMVFVPEGEFLMGSLASDPDARADEMPGHTVFLSSYWIDRTEVTNAMFAIFLEASGNQSEGGALWLTKDDPDSHLILIEGEWQAEPGFEDHPVVEVTWYGANAYCQWSGRELPTEAQWEKAARGLDGRLYPWGNEFGPGRSNGDNTGNNCDGSACDNFTGSAPVGSFPDGASPFDALDMAGNVWELTADYYGEDYFSSSPAQNPQGVQEGVNRVIKGGSFSSPPRVLRAARRGEADPSGSNFNIGFRCALSAP